MHSLANAQLGRLTLVCSMRVRPFCRYRTQGKLDKAIEFGQKALDIQIKALGEEHALVGLSYSSLSLV